MSFTDDYRRWRKDQRHEECLRTAPDIRPLAEADVAAWLETKGLDADDARGKAKALLDEVEQQLS